MGIYLYTCIKICRLQATLLLANNRTRANFCVPLDEIGCIFLVRLCFYFDLVKSPNAIFIMPTHRTEQRVNFAQLLLLLLCRLLDLASLDAECQSFWDER